MFFAPIGQIRRDSAHNTEIYGPWAAVRFTYRGGRLSDTLLSALLSLRTLIHFSNCMLLLHSNTHIGIVNVENSLFSKIFS